MRRRVTDGQALGLCFWARDGLFHFRMFGLILSVYRMRWVPFVMSTACHYDKRDEDWRCRGCARERAQ